MRYWDPIRLQTLRGGNSPRWHGPLTRGTRQRPADRTPPPRDRGAAWPRAALPAAATGAVAMSGPHRRSPSRPSREASEVERPSRALREIGHA
jgi:hypothetical protein